MPIFNGFLRRTVNTKVRIFLVGLLAFGGRAMAQQTFGGRGFINGDSIRTVVIDSEALVIAKAGLTEKDFIDQILRDTAFYGAFHALGHYSFLSENDVKTFEKDGTAHAHLFKKIFHDNSGLRYHQKILAQRDSGEVFKHNGKYKLFTLTMFSYIFENEESTDFKPEASVTKESEEGYKQKLKQLVFQPGRRIGGIPFISDKTEIFGTDLRKFYRYSFSKATYLDSVPVYRFKCEVLPAYRNDSRIMIKELTTIFDKKTFQILGRFIDMSYKNFLFDFDVRMNIELTNVHGELLPALVQYAGNWEIPFKKKEIASFTVQMHDFFNAARKNAP